MKRQNLKTGSVFCYCENNKVLGHLQIISEIEQNTIKLTRKLILVRKNDIIKKFGYFISE